MNITTSDGFKLDALYNKVGSEKVVVMAHGMTVDKDGEGTHIETEKELNNLGISTFRFDFRACGKSDGIQEIDFNTESWIKDLESIFTFLKDEGFSKIGLSAASFGASVASIYVGNNPKSINALFLLYPVLDYNDCFINPTTKWGKEYFENIEEKIKRDGYVEVGSRNYKVGNDWFQQLKKYNPGESLRNYKEPLKVVHGKMDAHVPWKSTKAQFDLLGRPENEFITLENAEHGFGDKENETVATTKLINFFLNNF